MNDYYSRLCDKTMKQTSKYKHIKSKNHITLESAIIRRYILLKPDFDKVDEILRKYIDIYNTKYVEFSVHCLLKVLTNTKDIHYNRMTPRSNLH